MPQAVSAVAVAAGNWAAGAVLASAGLGAASTAAIVGSVTAAVVEVGIYTGLALAVNAAFAPKVPGQVVSTPLKQPIPPRYSGFGRGRLGGFDMLFESRDVASHGPVSGGGVACIVLALHDGLVDGWEQLYLHDDPVTVDGSNRVQRVGDAYASRVYLETRDGLPTETVYDKSSTYFPDLWPTTSRLDGVASLEMAAFQSKPANQSKDYPNGLPQPSAAGRLQRVYDPRDGAQDQGDPDTWAWTDNPILHLMGYLTTANGGMGLDFDSYVLPNIADWEQAADDCDAVETVEGTITETRYRCGGVYEHQTAPADVIGQIISTCDGWLAPRGDGSLTVLAGKYYPPTVTITDTHVKAYQIKHTVPEEEVVNELRPTFTSAENLYSENDAGAWRNEADISLRGAVRSQAMPLPWCPSATQALRLAKRQMTRVSQGARGWVRTNLYGLNALGERYVRLQISDNAALNDIVVEVARLQIDLVGLTVTIDWVEADTSVDDWTEADQEEAVGQQPTVPERPAVDELPAPVISSVTPTYQNSASSDTGARLTIDVAPGVNASVEWLVRWRVDGTDNWNEGSYADIDDGPSVELITGFVTANATLEVEVAYRTAGRMSPWSLTETVVVDAPSTVFEQSVRDFMNNNLRLDDLADVDTTSSPIAVQGDVLAFAGGSSPGLWRPKTLALDDLSDVIIGALADGYLLTYDTDSPAGFKLLPPSVLALNDLNDVDTSGAADGYVLTYDTSSPTGWRPEAPAGGGGGALALISEQILGSAVSSVSFTSISGLYRDLILKIDARTSNASNSSFNVTLNSDTGANYDSANLQLGSAASVSEGVSTGQTSWSMNSLAGGNSTANYASGLELRLYNYSGTTFYKRASTQDGLFISTTSSNLFHWIRHLWWRNTAAVTRIDVAAAAGNFIIGSRFSLYGST